MRHEGNLDLVGRALSLPACALQQQDVLVMFDRDFARLLPP
jgi:hypothetical protein